MSTTQEDTEDLVTIRIPKRTADLVQAHLEIGTSPTALKGTLILFSVVGFGLMLAGMYGIFNGFTDERGDFPRFVDGAMGVGAELLGLAFFIGARLYAKEYKTRGLI